jgi:hypothetical protein
VGAGSYDGLIVIRGAAGGLCTVTGGKLDVNATLIGGGGDGAILDGVTSSIRATVHDSVDELVLQADKPLIAKMGSFLDLDTGGGEDWIGPCHIALPGAGGHVIGGTATDPLSVAVVSGVLLPVTALGDVAPGALDTGGNPVKVGYVATDSPAAAVDDGDRVDASADLRGRVRTRGDSDAVLGGFDGGQLALAPGVSTEIAAQEDRMYLEIQNNTGAVVFLALGRPALVSDYELEDGNAYVFSNPAVWTGSVELLSVAGGNANVVQY